MIDNFKTATRALRTTMSGVNSRSINGCCYGKDAKPDKGDYIKLCGQDFWNFLTGDPEFYVEIVKPLGYDARRHNTEFDAEYVKVVNRLTQNFLNDYCDPNSGEINWIKFVKYNSGRAQE